MIDRTPWYRGKVFDRPGDYWFSVWSQNSKGDPMLSPAEQAYQLCFNGQLNYEEATLLIRVALGGAECGDISAEMATRMINHWSKTHIAPCR
jgi:hypothetical protein